MAKYEIKGICGHYFTKELFGKEIKRQSYIEWATGRLECPDCYKLGLEKEKKEKYDKSREQAVLENLPILEGSEKQIQWAESIRILKLNSLREVAGKCLDNTEIIDYISKVVTVVKSKKEAKWFIDRKDITYSRSYFLERVSEEKAKEIGKSLVG